MRFTKHLTIKALAVTALTFASSAAMAQDEKPNILVIWGDDVGQSNISAYTMGLMGYRTPNIDRIAEEGMIFTDYYGEQSCTAGRSSYIMGQSVFRTGLSKVGLPGAELGMQEEDPTIAGLLKAQGYATGQFGKNHLGDRDEHLPTNHGFDEFFGNLYHLNAEEEPENYDYPGDAVMPDGRTFRETFGPRGVIRSSADGEIEDTGPLTKKRMETVDDETVAAAIDFIKRKEAEGTPWFLWWSGTRMHFRTHVSDGRQQAANELVGKPVDEYTAGMIEHDMHIGQFLDVLDELGIADKTIVHYSTDNGPHMNTWPDAAMTPFFGEKNTNWEGGWRVPSMVRWPGLIEPGSVSNSIMHHMDWLPTYLAAAGRPTIKEELLEGITVAEVGGGRDYRVHLDGYNFLPYFSGEVDTGPRQEIFYFSDDGDLTALRFNDWKLIFLEQKAYTTLRAWAEPWTELRLPLIFNLRRDPYERSYRTSNTYWDWLIDRAYMLVPAQAYVGQFLETFQEYPPRQKAASFSLEQVMEKLTETPGTP
ncbi:arylsulfatase [Roseobacter denitrificans]|uniref:Arylsulfatase n=2 Tax=Roseobacter denitrificans TaxID=2434 RepID=Q16CQ7_ROSDO|nr:arylsulfatase [Roseobacter denitrificans OCh 114]AVL53421.1 arylsulfatase [Roseobacter denitrificans]SFF70854.1 arylsulfatase [Roseobacter denitrificans OCh 114]